MRYFTWAGLTGSVLGFGCGSMLGRVGRADSLRAMGQAWDHGVTVFDVAPSYGFGEAEALLGTFLSGRREQALVVTKFGQAPRPAAHRLTAFKPAVRALLRLVPRARSAVRRVAASHSPPAFAASLVRPSVEASLRALRADYIDVLLLHGPTPEAIEDDALRAELAALVDDGLVRATGFSGPADLIDHDDETFQRMQVVQTNVNPFNQQALRVARSSDRLFIANHLFGGVDGLARTRSVLKTLAPHLPADVQTLLTEPDDRTLAEVVLGMALTDTGVSVAVPSMMTPAHIAANVSAVTDPRLSAEHVATIRALFDERSVVEARELE
ncbi:aldo/keto reductase [Desertimonas flava]|uniref:aldo/keto reductase n=1 Tax=Desertimonas flava TaxID=2064846 RepID=UPI000E351CF9|nr:aldo/keto reductase [Desertimonas flava]